MDFKSHIDRISKAASSKLADVGETKAFKAYLGDGTGTGNIQNLNGPYARMINFWRDTSEGREIGTAVLDSNANIPWSNLPAMENTEVVIAYPPRSKVPYAMRISREGTNQLPGGGISPTEQQISAAGYPFLRDVQDFRVTIQVPTSLEAKVTAGLYLSSIGVLTPWLGDDTSHAATTLTSIQSALTSGQHCLAWILFDTSTGLLETIGTVAVTAFGTLPARDEFDLPSQFVITPGANQFRLIPVYLYYGQTGLVEADLYRQYDTREPLGESTGGGGGGGGAIVTTTKDYDQRTILWDKTLSASGSFDTNNTDDFGHSGALDQTYDHLEIIGYLRALTGSVARITLNNDTTDANYNNTQLYWGTSSSNSDGADRQVAYVAYASSEANAFSSFLSFINDYTSAGFKSYLNRSNQPAPGGTQYGNTWTTIWRSTASITRIAMDTSGPGVFDVGSRLQIIGIKKETLVTGVTGAAASSGAATLVAGTVTVSDPSVQSGSLIFITPQEAGVLTGILRVSARVTSTSFTITSTVNTDTAKVAWMIVN